MHAGLKDLFGYPLTSALQDRRTHPDQGAALDYPALHGGQVADGHLVLQDGRQPLGGVQDAVVLHVAAGADHDRSEVGPQHRSVPDARAGGHGHVADQDRVDRMAAPLRAEAAGGNGATITHAHDGDVPAAAAGVRGPSE